MARRFSRGGWIFPWCFSSATPWSDRIWHAGPRKFNMGPRARNSLAKFSPSSVPLRRMKNNNKKETKGRRRIFPAKKERRVFGWGQSSFYFTLALPIIFVVPCFYGASSEAKFHGDVGRCLSDCLSVCLSFPRSPKTRDSQIDLVTRLFYFICDDPEALQIKYVVSIHIFRFILKIWVKLIENCCCVYVDLCGFYNLNIILIFLGHNSRNSVYSFVPFTVAFGELSS